MKKQILTLSTGGFLLMLSFFMMACEGVRKLVGTAREIPEIEIPDACTSYIEQGLRSRQKGECSGPYFIAELRFMMMGKALVIDISSVEGLGAATANRHSTVLYGDISLDDKKRVEEIYERWLSGKGSDHEISFYLGYWAGKKSELVQGELRDLIETIRKEFSQDKIPSGAYAPIHVEW